MADTILHPHTPTTTIRKPLDLLTFDDLNRGLRNSGYRDCDFDRSEFVRFTSAGDATYVIAFMHEGAADIGYLFAKYDDNGTLKVDF